MGHPDFVAGEASWSSLSTRKRESTALVISVVIRRLGKWSDRDSYITSTYLCTVRRSYATLRRITVVAVLNHVIVFLRSP
jgi:hypothetical protein